VPDRCTILKMSTREDGDLILSYKPTPRMRILKETFRIAEYAVKGVKARGVRLSSKEIKSVRLI
jgi:topoisomerase IV subunit A